MVSGGQALLLKLVRKRLSLRAVSEPPLPEELIGLWKLTESSGTTARDSGPNKFDMEFTSGSGLSWNGSPGYGLNFNRTGWTNQGLKTGFIINPTTTAKTILTVHKLGIVNSWPPRFAVFVDQANSYALSYGLLTDSAYPSGDAWKGRQAVSGGASAYYSSTQHHQPSIVTCGCMTFDGVDHGTFYLNGVADGTYVVGGSPTPPAGVQRFELGNDGGGYAGDVYYVMTYKKELSGTEVVDAMSFMLVELAARGIYVAGLRWEVAGVKWEDAGWNWEV